MLGINYIQRDDTNIEELIPDLQTPAFGFEKKLIIVKDTDLLKKQSKKKAQIIIEKIEKISNYITENIDNIREQNILYRILRKSFLQFVLIKDLTLQLIKLRKKRKSRLKKFMLLIQLMI